MLKIKKIKPMFTSIVTTMNKYEDDVVTNGIIDSSKVKGSIKEYQEVLAVGDSVRNIKVGDLVCINPSHYAVKKYKEDSIKDGIQHMNQVISYNFPVIILDDKERLLLQDRDIDFIIEEFEEISDIIVDKPKVII